ncbi:hypothetical protein M752DRAFT_317217 [Aspergillus phoenicis ATCC 13157]|uniref:Contig An01c0250, genomic contig n=3 Tax=Aspergillus TaxID=5052 RepID=A2Q999_ASPNC|nr:uncharacterized protein An01g07140 [Aspergillus niger]RDK46040.1 hypothetical protein M752DRAFT_317217 [Aspergillus phoenicis ATCC 13157]CAK43833.1 unnamed protein product [Aspergillus niger]
MATTSKKSDRRVPPEQRKRTEHSCDRCKSRKQKCQRLPNEDRCEHCIRMNYGCKVTRPRKQRLYGSAELVRYKIALLEALVKGLVPSADLNSIESMRELGQSLGIKLPEEVDNTYPPLLEMIQASEEANPNKNEELVRDMEGQEQYIGPASSYFFQMKLRALLGLHRQAQGGKFQMYLFGRNPSEDTLRYAREILTEADIRAVAEPQQVEVSANAVQYPSPLLDRSVINGLIRAYFDNVNIDFPVLHEASFLEIYDVWRLSPQSVDRAWVCELLCVLLLGRRISPLGTTETQQQKWWTHVESLLPTIIFTNNILSVQALMLAALHLHNTNHRDACWTLTGAAARIAIAIGLHRDEIICEGPRLAKELRKSLWWTLYAFEQIQVSSHDRPSAIDSTMCSTTSPHERVLGMGSSNWPPTYTLWSARLVTILGLVCRALPTATSENGRTGLLSPTAGLLRDLSRWLYSLPQHLTLSVLRTLPDGFKRPVLLLHIQYHYTVSLLTRCALLQLLASVSQNSEANPNDEEVKANAKVCCESGRKACELLLQLDELGKFNPVTWWDVYYVYSSTLVLTLSILCDRARPDSDKTVTDKDVSLLHDCASMLMRHSSNPMMPATMLRWTGAIRDVDVLLNERSAPAQPPPVRDDPVNNEPVSENALVPLGSSMREITAPYSGMEVALGPSTELAVSQMGLINMPFQNYGAGMDPLTDQSVAQMDPTMVYANGGHIDQLMSMPLLGDDNAIFSWDSIGSMLLGTEAFNAAARSRLAMLSDVRLLREFDDGNA